MPKATFHNLSAEKRARIIDAALDEFAIHPLQSASVNRVVKAAGIAKGSFYQYFDGLEDLYRYLVFDHGAELKMAAFKQAGPPPEGDLFDSLAWYGQQGLRWGLENPRLAAAAAHVRGTTVHPSMAPLAREVMLRSRAGLKHLLAEGQAKGAVRADLDLDAAVVLADVVFRHGFDEVFQARFGVDMLKLCAEPGSVGPFTDDDLAGAVHAVIDMLRRGLGTQQPAPESGRLDLDGMAERFKAVE